MHRQDICSDLAAVPALPMQAPVQSTGKVETERPRRPTVTTGMRKTGWNFFLHECGRYTRQTGIQDVTLRDKLLSSVESDLRQLAFSEIYLATTEVELLRQTKELSATVLDPAQCKYGKATTAAAVKPAKDKPEDEGENVKVAAVTGFLSAMLTESFLSTPENAAPLIQALRD